MKSNFSGKILEESVMNNRFLFAIIVMNLFLASSCMDESSGDIPRSKEPITFSKTLGRGIALSVRQTADGGYIICGGQRLGRELPPWYAQDSSFVKKTDALGNEEWSKTFFDTEFYHVALYGAAWHSIEETSDCGYIATLGNRVVRINAQGDLLWTKRDSDMSTCSVSQTADGGFILAWKNSFTHTGGRGCVTKTDAQGVTEWEHCYQSAYDVQQTTDGGYIACGTSVHIDESHNFFVYRTDSNGELEFSYSWYGAKQALAVLQDDEGNFVATGDYMVKLDSTGEKVWSVNLADQLGHSYSIQQTNDGGYVLAGNANSQCLDYNDSAYGYILKTDRDGNQEWSVTLESDSAGIYSVQQTTDGGYIAVGNKDNEILLMKTDEKGNVR